MQSHERIETGRLILRAPRMSDADMIAEMANNWNVSKNLGTMPYPYAKKDALEWLEKQEHTRGLNGFNFAIELKAKGNDTIGTVSVFGLGACKPELGYWLGEDYWGRGIMSEAVAAVRDFSFGDLNAPQLFSSHLLDNPASGRVAEKCGLCEYELCMIWSRVRRKFVPARRLKMQRMDWERLGAL